MSTTPNYDINYDDKRFTQVESDKKAALDAMENTYNGMISQSDKYFNDQIAAAEKYGETQKQNQQAQTDFAIEKIEQQKQQTVQDYQKEQSAAYADWQKQSNKYGVNAEQQAAGGMQNTGFSESSQVAMYNQYQQRVAVSRESVERAKLNYDNQMNEARLQNNVILAEIAYNTLRTSLELSLQGFQHKNTLLMEKLNKKTELENQYYQRYQDVLNQINTENAMKEEVRQYNESLAENKRQHNETLAENKRQHNETLAENKRQHNESISLENRKLKENMRQFNQTYALDVSKVALERQKYEDSKKPGGVIGGDGSSSKKGAKAAGKDSSSIRGSKNASSPMSAQEALTTMISNGATKDNIANAISLALRDGAITKKQAQELRNIYTPRGVQY